MSKPVHVRIVCNLREYERARKAAAASVAALVAHLGGQS